MSEKGFAFISKSLHLVKAAVLLILFIFMVWIIYSNFLIRGCGKYGGDLEACQADSKCRPVTRDASYFENMAKGGISGLALGTAVGGPIGSVIGGGFGSITGALSSSKSVGCGPCVHPPCNNFTCKRTREVNTDGITLVCKCPEGDCRDSGKCHIDNSIAWIDELQADGSCVCNYLREGD